MAESAEAVAPEIVIEAKAMGWTEKENFKGNPERWVDADVFVEKGREVLPIVKKHNTELRGQVTQLNGQVKSLNAAVKAAQESIEAMEELHNEDTKRKVEQARQDLLARLKVAKTDGDVDAEVQITDQLTAISTAKAEVKKTEAKVEPVDNTKNPEFVAWVAENPWFGIDEDRTDATVLAGQRLRRRGNDSVGKAFFDACVEEGDKFRGKADARPKGDNVEGNSRSTSRSNGKTWADLPADAKAGAAKLESKLVGEGRKFKDTAAYRKYYADKYFEE